MMRTIKLRAQKQPSGTSTRARRVCRAAARAALLALPVFVLAPPLPVLIPEARAQAAKPAVSPNQAPAGPNQAQADALFRQARTLKNQGRYKEACPLFEQSLELDPSPGTLLNLGNCYEQEGDLVRALVTFERVIDDAQRERDAAKRDAWVGAATRWRDSLVERVPLLTLTPSPTPGVSVRIDGAALADASQPVRLMPGHHALELSAAGKEPYAQEFDLALGQRLTLGLPALHATQPAPSEAAPELVAERTSSRPESDGGTQTLGWTLVGTGAGLGVLSVVTAIVASGKANQLEDECGPTPNECPGNLKGVRDSGQNWAFATYFLWAASGASAAVGATLLLVGDDTGSSATELRAGCLGASCGLSARGTF